ncbi:MAG: OmpA family protein, partial [Saprospiraceae bacterium]|nr:OmpA family protein [Saprospiraceae bacterium]
MTKTILFILSLAYAGNSFGQNLVKNPSFEEGQQCSETNKGTIQLEGVADWSAVAGSPTFWSYACYMSKEEKAYIQRIDMPPASEGDAFAGIGLDVQGDYLQGSLKKTLEKDKKYLVKMRVRFSGEMCNTPIRDLGLLFSDKPLEKTKKHRKIDDHALILQNNQQEEISARYEWETIHAIYIAKGNESHLAIGSFANNNKDVFEGRSQKECSYLFLDAISIEEFKTIQLPVFESTTNLVPKQRYILEGLRFNLGTPDLKDIKHKDLDSLALFLKTNPDVQLEVSAHTDDTNDEAMNFVFTKYQAQSIRDYLVKKGARMVQITPVGKGSSMNIALNTTEKGRLRNNRIEIRWV